MHHVETFVSCIQRAWNQLEEIIIELSQQLYPDRDKNGHDGSQDLLMQLFSVENSWLLKNPMKIAFPATTQWNFDKWTLPDHIESEMLRIISELRAMEGITLERVETMLADRVIATKQLLQGILKAFPLQSDGNPPTFIEQAIVNVEASDHRRLLEHSVLKLQMEIVQLECRLHCQSYRMERLERSIDKNQAALECDDFPNAGENSTKNGERSHSTKNGERSHTIAEGEERHNRLPGAQEGKAVLEKEEQEHSNLRTSDEDSEKLMRVINELRESYRLNIQSMVEEVSTSHIPLHSYRLLHKFCLSDPLSAAAHRGARGCSLSGRGVESETGRRGRSPR